MHSSRQQVVMLWTHRQIPLLPIHSLVHPLFLGIPLLPPGRYHPIGVGSLGALGVQQVGIGRDGSVGVDREHEANRPYTIHTYCTLLYPLVLPGTTPSLLGSTPWIVVGTGRVQVQYRGDRQVDVVMPGICYPTITTYTHCTPTTG